VPRLDAAHQDLTTINPRSLVSPHADAPDGLDREAVNLAFIRMNASERIG
jgi:hypothetical protein